MSPYRNKKRPVPFAGNEADGFSDSVFPRLCGLIPVSPDAETGAAVVPRL